MYIRGGLESGAGVCLRGFHRFLERRAKCSFVFCDVFSCLLFGTIG